MLAGQHASTRGAAQRVGDKRIGESHTIGGNAVEVGGLYVATVVAAHHLSRVVVGHDIHNVGARILPVGRLLLLSGLRSGHGLPRHKKRSRAGEKLRIDGRHIKKKTYEITIGIGLHCEDNKIPRHRPPLPAIFYIYIGVAGGTDRFVSWRGRWWQRGGGWRYGDNVQWCSIFRGESTFLARILFL